MLTSIVYFQADRRARNIELAEEDAEPLVPKDPTKPPIARKS